MTIVDFFGDILAIINEVVVPLIFAVAFIAFLWGVAQGFIFNGEDKEKRTDARKFLIYAIVGFFLMFSIWGITRVLVNTFGFDTATRPDTPDFGF